MLETFREKFGFFNKKVPLKLREQKSKRGECNLNAGADILAKYQREWMLLHGSAEENADKATKVYEFISKLRSQCDKQHEFISQLNSQLTLLPQLNQSVESLIQETKQLGESFDKVNSALMNLEHVIEIQELKEHELEHRFQLALLKEKRIGQLERLKVELANEHVQKVKVFELRQQALLKERQETFKEAFEEEMNHYKIHGRIERLPSKDKSIPLEDVELDDDSTALDAFLAEETAEEATEVIVQEYAIASALVEAIEDEEL